jgi:hypothetical protein
MSQYIGILAQLVERLVEAQCVKVRVLNIPFNKIYNW